MLWRKNALHYSCVWEDADILCQALSPVAQGRRLLSISSAGDNALALLMLDPSEVVAIDIDPIQLAALDLRLRAFEALEYDELLVFLGVHEGNDRLATYNWLRPALAEPSRVFWDCVPRAVHGGIIHAGKFERYMRWFRAFFPRRVRAALGPLAEATSATDRSRIYDEECNGPLWRMVTSLGFSPRAISAFDSRRHHFENRTLDVVRAMRRRLRHALIIAPWTQNPYLTYFLTGNYSPDALPLYLRPEHHRTIRSRIARLSFHRMGMATVATLGRFSGFNLSNVFEHLPPPALDETYQHILSATENGARLAYWYTFANHVRPSLTTRVKPLAIAKRLHEQDMVGTYDSLHIDEVSAE